MQHNAVLLHKQEASHACMGPAEGSWREHEGMPKRVWWSALTPPIALPRMRLWGRCFPSHPVQVTRALGFYAAGSSTCSGRACGSGGGTWGRAGRQKLFPCTAPQKKRASKKRRAQKDEERASWAAARGGTAPLAGRKSEAEELAARKVGRGGGLLVVVFGGGTWCCFTWRCVWGL
jgi:hypothetical protein